MGEMLSYGFGAIGKFLVILILLVVNSIWGIITNIIRHAMKWASDWLLERQIDSIAKASLKRQKKEAARPSTTTDMSVVE